MLFRSQISEKIKFGPLSSCRFREKKNTRFLYNISLYASSLVTNKWNILQTNYKC